MSRTIGLMMLMVLPPVLILYAAVTYGNAVPFWDQWMILPFFIKAAKGQLTFADMWAQHNEHRVFFPRAVWGVLAYLTDWNILYELVANVVMAGLIFGALALLIRQTVRRSNILPLTAVASLLVFSPLQAQNWWSASASRFSILGTLLAILFVTQWPGRWRGLAGAVGGAILASYSFNSGLLSLVVVGGMLFILRPMRKSFIVVWVAAAAVIVYFYYRGYGGAYHPGYLLGFVTHPLSFVGYVLAYLGLPLGFQNLPVSIAIGGILMGLLCWGTREALRAGREELGKALPWLALAAYAFLSAAATGVGRMLFFGVRQALSTRYATTSIIFTMAVSVVVAQAARRRQSAAEGSPDRLSVIFRLLCGACGIAYVLSFAAGWQVMVSEKGNRTGAHLIKYTPPTEYGIFRQRAALLTTERISIFAFDDEACAAARRRVTGGMGHIDVINGKPLHGKTEPVLIDRGQDRDVVLVGWAADMDNRQPDDKVLVVVDGDPVARSFYGLRRPDVSRAFEEDALLLTGWEAFAEIRNLERGVHRISIQVLAGDGSICYQPDRTYLIDVTEGQEEPPAGHS